MRREKNEKIKSLIGQTHTKNQERTYDIIMSKFFHQCDSSRGGKSKDKTKGKKPYHVDTKGEGMSLARSDLVHEKESRDGGKLFCSPVASGAGGRGRKKTAWQIGGKWKDISEERKKKGVR